MADGSPPARSKRWLLDRVSTGSIAHLERQQMEYRDWIETKGGSVSASYSLWLVCCPHVPTAIGILCFIFCTMQKGGSSSVFLYLSSAPLSNLNLDSEYAAAMVSSKATVRRGHCCSPTVHHQVTVHANIKAGSLLRVGETI